MLKAITDFFEMGDNFQFQNPRVAEECYMRDSVEQWGPPTMEVATLKPTNGAHLSQSSHG